MTYSLLFSIFNSEFIINIFFKIVLYKYYMKLKIDIKFVKSIEHQFY